jgi:hypothetical protein
MPPKRKWKDSKFAKTTITEQKLHCILLQQTNMPMVLVQMIEGYALNLFKLFDYQKPLNESPMALFQGPGGYVRQKLSEQNETSKQLHHPWVFSDDFLGEVVQWSTQTVEKATVENGSIMIFNFNTRYNLDTWSLKWTFARRIFVTSPRVYETKRIYKLSSGTYAALPTMFKRNFWLEMSSGSFDSTWLQTIDPEFRLDSFQQIDILDTSPPERIALFAQPAKNKPWIPGRLHFYTLNEQEHKLCLDFGIAVPCKDKMTIRCINDFVVMSGALVSPTTGTVEEQSIKVYALKSLRNDPQAIYFPLEVFPCSSSSAHIYVTSDLSLFVT